MPSNKPRRARGDGTIYLDKTRNRYVGAVTINGQRRKVSAKTKTDARAKLSELLATKNTGAPLPNQRTTVADAVETFLERDVPNRTSGGRPLAPATVEKYRWIADTIIAELGTVRLAALTVHDVEAMLDRLAKRETRPMSAASLRMVRGTLRRALTFAERRGEVVRNVAEHATITPTATGTRSRRALTPDQARTLLAALRTERLGSMYALMLRVALRPGEAAGVYWSELDGSTLNITRAVRLTNGRAEVVDNLKTESSKRTIELPADLVDWLADHRAAQIEERLAAPLWADERLMFASPRGSVLSPPNVRRDLARICRAAKLPAITPNELRHSCASLLSDIGVANEAIADLLGHTTTRMVDSVYRHRLRPVVDIAARADWTVSGS